MSDWSTPELPYLKAIQQIGELYFVVLPARVLVDISFADRRELVEEYGGSRMFMGIQRHLSKKRVKQIADYVETRDATFPGTVILSINERCVSFNDTSQTLTLHSAEAGDAENEPIPADKIARIIDGQHRIEGLKHFDGSFEVPATLFIGADEATEAAVFSTVNLAQTKVNRSLAIDLLEIAKARSPQKTCHNIAVALDASPTGPLGARIKRLGVATEGRDNETLTQATFVDGLLRLVTRTPEVDRERYRRGKKIDMPTPNDLQKTPLRRLFFNEKDQAIARGLEQYLRAVRERWPIAWDQIDEGGILSKTAGYSALVRLWGRLLREWSCFDELPEQIRYKGTFADIKLADEELTTQAFGYGTGAEAELYRRFISFLQ